MYEEQDKAFIRQSYENIELDHAQKKELFQKIMSQSGNAAADRNKNIRIRRIAAAAAVLIIVPTTAVAADQAGFTERLVTGKP